MKPALTQPWGLTDVPEHLIWAFGGRWNPFPRRLVSTRVCWRILFPVVFVRFTYLSWLNVCLKNEQVANVVTRSSQALLRFFFHWELHVDLQSVWVPLVKMLTFHDIFSFLIFFHQVQKWTRFIQKLMKMFVTSPLICNLRCYRTDFGEPAL